MSFDIWPRARQSRAYFGPRRWSSKSKLLVSFILNCSELNQILYLFIFQGSDNFSVRSDTHILVVGDPGLGKSQLLRACANVSPRGIYVCGSSTTSAGLTVFINLMIEKIFSIIMVSINPLLYLLHHARYHYPRTRVMTLLWKQVLFYVLIMELVALMNLTRWETSNRLCLKQWNNSAFRLQREVSYVRYHAERQS